MLVCNLRVCLIKMIATEIFQLITQCDCVCASATERRDVRRVRGVDGRRPVPLQDLYPGVPRRLPGGAGLPARRGPAGDERYGPHCYRLELLLLCKCALLTASDKHAGSWAQTNKYTMEVSASTFVSLACEL